MKAILYERYGPPDVLELREIDTPVAGDGEVLVRVRAASANPYDWHFMRGEPYFMRMTSGVRSPKITGLGADVAGQVEAVGANVTRFRPGDEVFGDVSGSGWGTFGEYVSAPEAWLETKPANLTFEQAAAVPLAGLTALQGLRDHGQIQSGQRVLIIGAGGGVGTFAVQIAKSFGADVTGVCSTGKVDLVRSLGADHVIDYTRDDLLTSGERYDLVFQLSGASPASELRRALTSKGTLVLSSGEGGGRWFGPVGRIVRALVSSPFVSQRVVTFVAKKRAADLHTLKELLEAGTVRPVIDRTYTLTETPEAIGYLEEGHASGKVVISV